LVLFYLGTLFRSDQCGGNIRKRAIRCPLGEISPSPALVSSDGKLYCSDDEPPNPVAVGHRSQLCRPLAATTMFVFEKRNDEGPVDESTGTDW